MTSTSVVTVKKPFSTFKRRLNKDFIRKVYRGSADTKKYSISFFFEGLKKFLLNQNKRETQQESTRTG